MNGIMENSKYDIIAFDAQYFLHRNFEALKGRTAFSLATTFTEDDGVNNKNLYLIDKYEFEFQSLVKQFFWTIAKAVREKFPTHRIILLWDQPPYHKLKWIPDYKGSRVHHCQETLDEWDVEGDPQGYLQEKENVRIESIKNEAKWWIIGHLGKVGMPSLIFKGYEADDLAYIFSNKVKLSGHCGICSCDSDWQCWISENVDWLSFNRTEVWTLKDVYDDWSHVCEHLGISIFEAKELFDSTMGGHNDLGDCKCTLGWREFEQLYNEVKNEDYTHIGDVETFKNNLKTFEIEQYPNYDSVVKSVQDIVSNEIPVQETAYDSLRHAGFQVSQSYFNDKYLSFIDVPTRV